MARVVSQPQARIAEIATERVELEAQLPELERQLTDTVAACSPTGNFAPAREIGQRVQMTREKLVELAIERDAALSAEEKRLADARAKEDRSRVRSLRAKYGEWNRSRRGDRNDALADAERHHRRAVDAVSAIGAMMPDEIEWPSGFWLWEGEFTPREADERSIARVKELDRFFETTFAALAAALPNADTAGEPVAK